MARKPVHKVIRMKQLSPRLSELLQRLDQHRGEWSLVALAETLEAAQLTVEDVRSFIVPDERGPNRVRVARRDHYELVVTTWQPGQADVPLDHEGTVSAYQVLQGRALETSFTVAADGFVDRDYSTELAERQVSGVADVGVHALENPSPDVSLVTVHIDTPPLHNVRRFTARPVEFRGPATPALPTVVIIGGGFSGTMTAAQLLRRTTQCRIVLVERRGTVAEGVAYSTLDPAHLLNVPAGRMSAWPDRPLDFANWARGQDPGVSDGDFLPRQLYGRYLRETLSLAARDTQSRFEVVLDEVSRVARHPRGGWAVHPDRGATIRADVVVLAIGHRPPSDPLREAWSGPKARFLCDPWVPFAVSSIPGDESVAVLGTGLTAIDTVLSLMQQPRTAPVTLISRGGLLPHAHSPTPVVADDLREFIDELVGRPGGLTAARLARAVQSLARKRVAGGGNWRSVVDGLRPHTARLWQSLPEGERKRLVARVRPFWEVHRHRMAMSIADRMRSLIDQSLVRLIRGRVAKAEATGSGVVLEIVERGQADGVNLVADWVVNCTGPMPSNSVESNPAIGSLMLHGWLRRDRLSLGLDTAEAGEAVAAAGETVPDLFVVGTLRKPQFWESTAVPELRQQAEATAARIIGLLALR